MKKVLLRGFVVCIAMLLFCNNAAKAKESSITVRYNSGIDKLGVALAASLTDGDVWFSVEGALYVSGRSIIKTEQGEKELSDGALELNFIASGDNAYAGAGILKLTELSEESSERTFVVPQMFLGYRARLLGDSGQAIKAIIIDFRVDLVNMNWNLAGGKDVGWDLTPINPTISFGLAF